MTTPLSLSAIEHGFAAGPRLFPHSHDIAGRRVLVLDLPETVFLSESFLDDRLFQSAPSGGWMPEADFLRITSSLSEPKTALGFVFHVGHCGSTLISRLLATGGAFPVREPVPLRTLADARCEVGKPWDPLGEDRYRDVLNAFTRSWARRPAGAAMSVVKATSLASGLAPDLLAAAPQTKALALRLPLAAWLAALLAPEEPSADLMRGARVRLSRLAALAGGDPGIRLHALSPGELAAASWLAEAATLARLAADHPERVHGLDFETFLARPEASLLAVARHFGLPWEEADAEAAVRSPLMQRYSKAPDQGFTPQDRTEQLAESAARNRAEIAKGRNLAGRLVEQFDGLRGAADWL